MSTRRNSGMALRFGIGIAMVAAVSVAAGAGVELFVSDRGQQPALPQPDEGDFVIRDFVFASGERLPELTQHYRTLGTLRKDAEGRATNAVLIGHGTTGSGGQFSSRAFAGELRSSIRASHPSQW